LGGMCVTARSGMIVAASLARRGQRPGWTARPGLIAVRSRGDRHAPMPRLASPCARPAGEARARVHHPPSPRAPCVYRPRLAHAPPWLDVARPVHAPHATERRGEVSEDELRTFAVCVSLRVSLCVCAPCARPSPHERGCSGWTCAHPRPGWARLRPRLALLSGEVCAVARRDGPPAHGERPMNASRKRQSP